MLGKGGAADLFVAPWTLLDVRVEVIMPALAALLAHSAGEVLGDLGPTVPILIVKNEDHLVFLVGPLVLLDVWVEMIVPPSRQR